ncbi:MAG TPA: DnaJ domain-containing protein [Thermoanaerobaculia bacterium]|nr:DnaJ domain-containing protein [Thermoanaerobaculia bacterium]
MEMLLIVFMLGAGLVLAGVVYLLVAAANRRSGETSPGAGASPSIAGAILHAVARAGGASVEEAVRRARLHASGVPGGESRIDIRNWAERFAERSGRERREELLESAVHLAVEMHEAIPLAQYQALLDLSFGLGFHPDALARLRARYRFAWVDHSQNRPRSADRSSLIPFQNLDPSRRGELCAVLELRQEATKDEIVGAYRRLAGIHHPDRFHSATDEEQRRAGERFIAITDAYERLLMMERK